VSEENSINYTSTPNEIANKKRLAKLGITSAMIGGSDSSKVIVD